MNASIRARDAERLLRCQRDERLPFSLVGEVIARPPTRAGRRHTKAREDDDVLPEQAAGETSTRVTASASHPDRMASRRPHGFFEAAA